MTAFLIFAPAVLDHSDYAGKGEAMPVNVCGLYPIHDAERRYTNDHELEAFCKLDPMTSDVSPSFDTP